MELQINKVEGKQVKRTVDNVIISEGSLTYCVKNNEYGVDLDNIDDAIITDSPAPDLAAENERLRAALEQIANGNPAPPGGKWLSDSEMAMIARAALAKAEGGE